MATRKIGVTATSLHMPFDKMLPLAKEMGITGLQLWGVGGEHDARSLSKDDRKRLLDQIQFARNGDLRAVRRGRRVYDPETSGGSSRRAARAVIDMAVDMDVRVVSGHVGVIPEDHNDPKWICMPRP